MKIKTIKNWNDLSSLAQSYMMQNWIFRGVGDADHNLVPKIGREGVSKDLESGKSLGYSAEYEEKTIQKFKREARPHLKIEPSSNLEWLSIAQHHGLPTRLLDWSESPLIAAYFALRSGGFKDKEPCDAVIFGVECPDVLENDDNDIDAVSAYYPSHLTNRITAQRGLFTYHPKPSEIYSPSGLIQWRISSKICFTLKVILNKAGFNEASMFPDLDATAKHVAWQLKWHLL